MNDRFCAARHAAALSRKELAELVRTWIVDNRHRDTAIDEMHIGRIERGSIHWPNADYRAGLRAVLKAESDSELGFRPPRRSSSAKPTQPDSDTQGALSQLRPREASSYSMQHYAVPDVDGIEAIELLRRVEATDVGPATLDALAHGVDRLCRSYTQVAPPESLMALQVYRAYVARLLDGRATIAQRRDLMRQAGWLSLLTATADLDVGYDRAAGANLDVARSLAIETGDLALAAWVHETEAWQALSSGQYGQAAHLSRSGLEVAPKDSSAYAQLCTQLARASARLGDSDSTYRMVEDCSAVLDRMPAPEQPEHHFVCDPRRAVAFCAAALVWLGENDAETEQYARQAVAQYETADDVTWVHRLALARLNLALLLARTDEPTEAAHVGSLALKSSWRLCRTDLFVAADLDRNLTDRHMGDREVTSFHDHYLDVLHSMGSQARPDLDQVTSGRIDARLGDPPGGQTDSTEDL